MTLNEHVNYLSVNKKVKKNVFLCSFSTLLHEYLEIGESVRENQLTG